MPTLKTEQIGPLQFKTREGTFDRGIIGEVIAHDAYRIRLAKRKGVEIERVIDVGAHIGVFVRFVKHLYPNAEVWAFEADPDNFSILQRNVANLDKVHLFNQALSDKDGQATFYSTVVASSENTGGGSLERPDDWDTREIEVTLRDVNSFFDEALKDNKLDILKLDCEGSEYAIVRALIASGRIAQVQRIAGEYHRALADIKKLCQELMPTHVCTYSSSTEAAKQGTFQAKRKKDDE